MFCCTAVKVIIPSPSLGSFSINGTIYESAFNCKDFALIPSSPVLQISVVSL